MKHIKDQKIRLLGFDLAAGIISVPAFADDQDFGQRVEHQFEVQSQKWFGINQPLDALAPPTTGAYRSTTQAASDQMLLAKGLKVEYLTRSAANLLDMFSFYPAQNPTHLIACIEGGRQVINADTGKLNPSVQSIDLNTGEVKTILRGMSRCDGIRTTDWGTIVATEETGDGAAYEILDPLAVSEQSVIDRTTGVTTDPLHIQKRAAVPIMAWEGLEVLPSGVVIGGDELRPGDSGYYRPEDLHRDPLFVDSANPEAVRVCWTNTGNEDTQHFAEVMCAVDSAPLVADPAQRTVVANRFVEGDSDFNSFDNLDFQPGTGNLYVIEDHDNGDIFACLPDGGDHDIKTDGCVKVISVKDTSAEPTGFIFSADGETAYLSIQHSDDTNMPLVDDYPTDDLLKITGFKVRKANRVALGHH